MAQRPRQLRATRVHGPGRRRHVDITFTNERLHANGVFSNVYAALLTEPRPMAIAIKKCWPRNSRARRTSAPAATVQAEEGREDANDGKAEIALLARLKHPHIVLLLYTFSVKVDADVCNCMVLEFLSTDLAKLLRQRHQRSLDALDAKLYAWQLFAALDYVNAQGVAHRDVKPANLLVEETLGLLKLADFGNAKVLRAGEDHPPYQVTRYYRAPELVFGSRRYSTKVDVWAAACVMGELLTGRPLLPGSSNYDQGKLLVDLLGYPSSEALKAMGVEQRPRLIRREARGLKAILPADKVDTAALDLLSSILRYEPSKRLRYEFILGHEYFDALRQTPTLLRHNNRPLPALDFWISEESTQDASEASNND